MIGVITFKHALGGNGKKGNGDMLDIPCAAMPEL